MMTKIREGYKETEIGVIPKDWEVTTLETLFDFYGGYSIPRANLSNDGVFYIHYGDIHTRTRSYICTEEDSNWLPRLKIDREKANASLKTGDIVFADASEDYEGVGKSVVIFSNNQEIVAGLHTIVAKDKENNLSLHFKRYFLEAPESRKQFKRLATGSKVYGISKGNLAKIVVAVPSIVEQQRIAEILSTTDRHIEKLDKTIEDYQLLKKGIMKKLLTEGIGHTEFKETEIGRIPKEWEVKKLGQITIDMYQGINTVADKVEYIEDGYPIIQAKHMTQGVLDLSDVKYLCSNDYNYYSEKYKPCVGDILVSNIGTIGKVLKINTSVEFLIAWNVFMLKVSNSVDSDYLSNYLKRLADIGHYDKLTTGNATKFINKTAMRDIKIAVPKMNEQLKIAALLNTFDDLILRLQENKVDYIILKKALMENLLTGKLRTFVPEEEGYDSDRS